MRRPNRAREDAREWPHTDSIALPPTHCSKCGERLIATIVIKDYEPYGGAPRYAIALDDPHTHLLTSNTLRHRQRYHLDEDPA